MAGKNLYAISDTLIDAFVRAVHSSPGAGAALISGLKKLKEELEEVNAVSADYGYEGEEAAELGQLEEIFKDALSAVEREHKAMDPEQAAGKEEASARRNPKIKEAFDSINSHKENLRRSAADLRQQVEKGTGPLAEDLAPLADDLEGAILAAIKKIEPRADNFRKALLNLESKNEAAPEKVGPWDISRNDPAFSGSDAAYADAEGGKTALVVIYIPKDDDGEEAYEINVLTGEYGEHDERLDGTPHTLMPGVVQGPSLEELVEEVLESGIDFPDAENLEELKKVLKAGN